MCEAFENGKIENGYHPIPTWVHNVLNLVKHFFLLESVLHRGHFFEIVSNNYDWEKKEDVAITDENPLKQDTDFSY